jgi:putative ABC transport system substrate-binding protein
MNRRRFVSGLGLLALVPAAAAQPAGKVPRIGILLPGPLAPRMHQWDAFRQTLRGLGYTEGQNVILEFRPAAQEGDSLENLAADLARLKVDVIVAVGDRAIQAARNATRTIPIVMCPSQDAVGQGFVARLARPGGNITGISTLIPDLAAKRLELLREIAPEVSRIAVMWSPPDAAFRATELAARAIRIEIVNLKVSRADDLDKAFEAAVTSNAAALLVPGGPVLYGLRARVTEFALKRRLPALYFLPAFADAGGLAVYGPNDVEYCRQAAVYVAKILKGAKPADLPVEQPTRFEMIVNLKTARAQGIQIPQSILLRADRVIE